jgi:uncharacterized membrane protein YkvI
VIGDEPVGADDSLYRRLFSGWFGKLVLPGIVLQSVLIGGGYATGREIVAYGARFGPEGWIAVVAIFVGFTVMAALTFEVARVFQVYEYKGFVRQIIWKAWPLFDLLFALMAVLVIAVMASAAAEIMDETLGVPSLVGTGIIVVAVGVLSYFGSRVIEAFKSFGTGLLYVAYLVFGVLVLSQRWGEVTEVFAGLTPAYLESVGTPEVLGAGVLYVGYNLVAFPAVLFTLRRQTSRRETLVASVVAGLMMTLPFALTYLCLMAYYPSTEVMDAAVPWLPMLEAVGGGPVVAVFGIVMGWTLLETSVGLIHALLDRVDEDLKSGAVNLGSEKGDEVEGAPAEAGTSASGGLSRLQSGLLGAGILVAAAALSRVGIVALVARGYTMMGYLFIGLFGVPLLTIGLWRIFRPDRGPWSRSSAPARRSG